MKHSLVIHSLFQQLSDEQRKNIELFCQEKTLETGEVLFHEGDEPQALYIVASGSLSVQKWLQKKEIAVLHAGEMLGEMAFFGTETKRNATLIAREKTELIVLLAFSLVQLFNQYPDIKEKLTSLIDKRIEHNKKEGF